MKPQRHSEGALTDLLNRTLDRGLLLHADLVISLADVDLVGVKLQAAVAGIETMVEYGLLEDETYLTSSVKTSGAEKGKQPMMNDTSGISGEN